MAAGLLARQLAHQGIDTVVIERGGDHQADAAGRIPTQRDELRWDIRLGLMQNAASETYTLRRSRQEPSRPMRRFSAFLPGTGVGGAGTHWNGQVWRWAACNMALRSHFEGRYGGAAIPTRPPPSQSPALEWHVP